MAFVGLVGLYACIVRRLEVRKRKTCKFIGFIGFIGLLRSCGCFAWFVLLLLRSCSLLVVVVLLVVLFPFGRYDKKERAHLVGASSLCGLWACYIALGITKLLQAVSILKELPTTQATEKKLQL